MCISTEEALVNHGGGATMYYSTGGTVLPVPSHDTEALLLLAGFQRTAKAVWAFGVVCTYLVSGSSRKASPSLENA